MHKKRLIKCSAAHTCPYAVVTVSEAGPRFSALDQVYGTLGERKKVTKCEQCITHFMKSRNEDYVCENKYLRV